MSLKKVGFWISRDTVNTRNSPVKISFDFFIDERTDDSSIEILTIHHVVKGLENMQNTSPLANFNFMQEQMKKNPIRPYILNYRFLRKFNRSGEGGEWIINALNHISGRKLEFKMSL